MALTRKQIREWLSEAGMTDEAIAGVTDKIIAGHTATTDSLNEQLATMKAEADKVPGLIKAREEAEKSLADGMGWQEKYTALVEERKTDAKRNALRRALTDAGLNANVLDLIVSTTDLKGIEVDDRGTVSGTEAVISPLREKYGTLFASSTQQKMQQPTPPSNGGGTTDDNDLDDNAYFTKYYATKKE